MRETAGLCGEPGALDLRRSGSRGAGAPRRLVLPRAGAAVRPAPHPGGAGARRAGRAGAGHVGQLRRASSADHAFEQAQAARRRSPTPPDRTVRDRERGPLVAGGPRRGRAGRARRAVAAPSLRRGVQAAAGSGGRVPHRGASWFRRIGAWRAGERFAAGGSSPACRASSSRFPKRWVSSAQCAASRLRDDWLRSAPRTRST